MDLFEHMIMIHDIKKDSILQVSSEESLTSSKYDFKDRVFLAQFYSWYKAENCNTSLKLHIRKFNSD